MIWIDPGKMSHNIISGQVQESLGEQGANLERRSQQNPDTGWVRKLEGQSEKPRQEAQALRWQTRMRSHAGQAKALGSRPWPDTLFQAT